MGILSSTLPVLLAVVFISFLPPSASASSLTAEGLFVYDADLNISWMKNGAYAQTEAMTWQQANAWLTSLNEQNYGGYSDWRLPTTPYGNTWGYDPNINSTKYNVTTSELGHLFYIDLQQNSSTSSNPQPDRDFSPFINLRPYYYWFGTIEKSSTGFEQVWKFDFQYGTQFLDPINTNKAYAIAVRDAIPAPEPSSALLFLAGLLGLCRIQHQRNRQPLMVS